MSQLLRLTPVLNRQQTIAALSGEFDAIVIGGGINGAVSTAALAAHGINVVLVESNDFASMTSQESSNMIWGGLKYLQDYEFSLVWSLCRSRNELLSKYPNRIQEIPFFAVINQNSPFSRALGYVGSLLYWFFGSFKTNKPRVFSTQKIRSLNPQLDMDRVKGAIQYNDAILLDNDARFVYEFIKTGAKLGAKVLNYAEVTKATSTTDGWLVNVRDKLSGSYFEVKAKTLINATGPYAKSVSDSFKVPTENKIVMSKGVHLIVPRIETNDKVFAFFDEKGRLFYVLPMHDRTVIGTTDTKAQTADVSVTDEDRNFLLDQINRCLNLQNPLTKADIISERCGVRPLVITNSSQIDEIDWLALSRKHVVELNSNLRSISIFGGKLTDCINVGYEVVTCLKEIGIVTKPRASWIGEPDPQIDPKFIDLVSKHHKSNTKTIATEIWRRHGAQSSEIVMNWISHPDDAELVFPGLSFTLGELRYIIDREHVQTSEDLLRRRTPIALLRTQVEIKENAKLQSILKTII